MSRWKIIGYNIPTAFKSGIEPIYLPNGIPRQRIAVMLLLIYFPRTHAMIWSEAG